MAQIWAPPDLPDSPPVILFLHGAGERGSDDLAQTTVGLGPAIRKYPDRYPFVTVFPQLPIGEIWTGRHLERALESLDEAIERHRCDPKRVYLTGISMGGNGTWSLALQEPHRFAAIAPVCGWLQPNIVPRHAAETLAHLPAWIFHGEADTIVRVRESRVMADALREAGANVRYTEYAGVAHNSWDRAYGEPEFPPWLLASD